MDGVEGELLRVEVRRLKTLSGRRRATRTDLNVGDLAGARLVVPLSALGPAHDVPLATDALTRAFDRLGHDGSPPVVWLTRSGDLEPGDDDWRWRAATSAVRRQHGWEPGRFFVVTRHGWLELPSGERREWTRMRASWRPPYDDERDVAGEDDLGPAFSPDEPHPVEGWPIRF